ncbi:MAG: DUF5677 domain-containing protein [Candidatus Neomarinimicrobiota bacterium]
MLVEKFEAYEKETVTIFEGYLKERRSCYDRLFSNMYKLYILFNFLVDDQHVLDLEKAKTPIAILYAKTALSHFGIYHCLFNGLIIEASILLRSLFEIYVDVKVILEKDVEDRIPLWYDFKYITRKKQLDKNLELLESQKISLEQFESTYPLHRVKKANEEYENVKANYNNGKSNHWAWSIYSNIARAQNKPITTKFICEQLGISSQYVKVFSALSISTHSDSLIENLLVDRGKNTCAPIFNSNTISIGALAVLYAGSIIEDVVKYLQYEYFKVFMDILAEISLSALE